MKRSRTFAHAGGETTVRLAPVSGEPPAHFAAEIDDEPVEVRAERIDDGALRLELGGRTYVAHVARSADGVRVFLDGYVYELATGEADSGAAASAAGSPEVRSTMPGKILEVLVNVGDEVSAGDDLVILEAMKMENRLRAEIAGRVAAIEVSAGDRVEGGDLLVRLESDPA